MINNFKCCINCFQDLKEGYYNQSSSSLFWKTVKTSVLKDHVCFYMCLYYSLSDYDILFQSTLWNIVIYSLIININYFHPLAQTTQKITLKDMEFIIVSHIINHIYHSYLLIIIILLSHKYNNFQYSHPGNIQFPIFSSTLSTYHLFIIILFNGV